VRACNICQSQSYPIWQDKQYTAYRCRNCGVAFLGPIPGDPGNIFNEHYFRKWYVGYYEGRKEYLKELWSVVEKYFSSPGKLLDVGCGTGIFLELMREKNAEVYGQDISPSAVSFCRDRGFEVFEEPLPSSGIEEEAFDTITMWDVLAHLKDPMTYLNECRKILKPGGHLIIKTPFHSRKLFHLANRLKFTGKSRGLLHIPAQIYHFDPSSLRMVLEKFAGFECKELLVIPERKSLSLKPRSLIKILITRDRSIVGIFNK
jgi:SAM-dependent methyltransferase